jgi:hypothetical protein
MIIARIPVVISGRRYCNDPDSIEASNELGQGVFAVLTRAAH